MSKEDIKSVNVTCPKCEQDLRHGGFAIDGTNQRGDITSNLLTAFDVKPDEHLFYRQRSKKIIDYLKGNYTLREINRDRSMYLRVPDPVEGHHLITCEAVKGDDWFKLFYQYCYDINCPQNGVILPGDMLVACHFGAPLHMGNHEATAILNGGVYEYGTQKNYVIRVYDRVKDMMEKFEVTECKKVTASKIKAFHADMLLKSNYIYKKVRDFKWLISSDGMHYHESSKIGCYADCRTLTQKRRLMARKTGVVKGSDSTVDWVIAITKEFEESGTMGCKQQNRNHHGHGCPTSQKVNWEECRWDTKDPEIENLQDDEN